MTQTHDPSGNLPNPAEQRRALRVLAFLFFMWGFLSCLNDLLVPYMRGVFELSYAQAMLVQFSFFSAYFLCSVPLGFLVNRIGYRAGIVFGLCAATTGCLLFYPAAQMLFYPAFLFALFVLAIGICCLQVAANPYVVRLGSAETGSRRLNLTQGFNSLGTVVAPYFAALFIFAGIAGQDGAESVKLPYLAIALALALLALMFARLDLPDPGLQRAEQDASLSSAQSYVGALRQIHVLLMSNRPLLLGALGIFFYVGVEVSVGSLLLDFLMLPDIAGMSEAEASRYVIFFWLGAMLGRFGGFLMMSYVPAQRLLLFNALSACVLVSIAVHSSGAVAMWSLLAVGLCNSIMFPTIFSLSIGRLGAFTGQGSGVLCLAIVGGAVIPLLQGVMADWMGLQPSLILTVIGYLYIAYYARYGFRARAAAASDT